MQFVSYRSSLPISLVVAIGLITGCGSGPGTPPPPSPSNTTVTLMLSSTANDQLSGFDMTLTGLTLTNQAGKTVSVFDSQQKTEFMHLNGTTEPLMTVSIPQDTYTAASATVGYAQFTCVALDPSTSGLDISTFAYGETPANQVTVNLPAPLKIAGTATGLTLNLQVHKSASYGTCGAATPINPYSIDPTFTLSGFDVPSVPVNGDGLMFGMGGLVASAGAGANTFAAIGPNGESWTVESNASTIFQGISGPSDLKAGMPVDIDAAVQADGTLMASRVAVSDTDTTNLSISSGPLLNIASSQPTVNALGRLEQGFLYAPHTILSGQYFSFGQAKFQISGEMNNLQSLPFTASFNGTNMVAGQNVLMTSHATALSQGPTYIPASTVTLIPQTINGTVGAVSTEGDFDVYAVQLAPYDLMPTLAVQPGQTTMLANPATVMVYVDRNTRMQNTIPLDGGNVLRFYGLLLKDQGTLKMDCAQVNDGVTE